MPLNLRVTLLRDVKPPTRGTVMSAGFDLHTPYNLKVFCNMNPMEIEDDMETAKETFANGRIPLGFKTEFAEGYVGLVMSRSGLGSKQGLHVRNLCGVIDADYRGEWQAAVRVDSEQHSAVFAKGDAILQVVFVPFAEDRKYTLVDEDGNETVFDAVATLGARGEGGFGSTSA